MTALSRLLVHRHDTKGRALITLVGEIDLASAPLIRDALARCLRDGVRTVAVDLSAVTFCDCTGVNAFLSGSRLFVAAGGSLRLHHPNSALTRLFALTGVTSLPGGRPRGALPPARLTAATAFPSPAADPVGAALPHPQGA